MTTDPGLVPLPFDRAAIRRAIVRGSLAVAGWLLLVVALTPLFPMSDTVIAIGPPERLLRALPEGGVVTLAAGSVSLALAVETPAQVRSLYRAGAWLVLPATRGACIEQARAAPRPMM
ncbi:MAG: hypothetical protein K2W80_10905 [Burkholderiales bacterium]|nr:hypothetical protein [Burkholderiales bacterium]